MSIVEYSTIYLAILPLAVMIASWKVNNTAVLSFSIQAEPVVVVL